MDADLAFEAGFKLGHEMRKLDIAMRALKEIADEDFRGNRPSGSVKAFHALEEIAQLETLNDFRNKTGSKPDEK